MSRTEYWMINCASLLLAGLIGFEIDSVHQLDGATALLRKAQAPLVQAQQQTPAIQHLLQRTAVGATRDPALREMLAKYGFAFTVSPRDPVAAAPNP